MNSVKPKQDPPGSRMIKYEQGVVKLPGVEKSQGANQVTVIGVVDVADLGNSGGSK